MKQTAVTQTHAFHPDDITDWLNRPLCATCGLLPNAKRHQLPDTAPEVLAAEARKLGETP